LLGESNVSFVELDTTAFGTWARQDRPVRGSAGVETGVDTHDQRYDAKVGP
jgi:hypothetical protein